MQKKLYFGTNLKMYKTIADTVFYLQKLESNTKDLFRLPFLEVTEIKRAAMYELPQ